MQSQYRFLKTELSVLKKPLSTLAFVYMVQSVLLVLFPLPIKFALDHVLSGDLSQSIEFLNHSWYRKELLFVLGFSSLVLGALITLLEFVDERISSLNIAKLVTLKKDKFINQIVTRQFSWLESKRKMDLLGRLSGDTQNLELFVSSLFAVMFRALPTLLFAVAAMFYVNTQFAIIVLVLMPALYGSISLISKQIKKYEKKLRSSTNAYDQEALQTLTSISLLKSLQGEAEAINRLEQRQQTINREYLKTKMYSALLNSGFSISRNLLRSIVLVVGGLSILSGNLSLGALFAFVSYLEALNRPVGEITNLISRWGKANASTERLIEIENEMNQNAEHRGEQSIPVLHSTHIKFKNLNFGYDIHSLLFKNLNLDFRSGEIIGLVGTSGVGKSSLIKIINGLNNPTSGQVLLNDVDITKVTKSELRGLVCVISQDSFFLTASIRENLNLGLPTFGEASTDEQIWQALRLVNADQFVADLPQKLDTIIGESGVQLSGGQSKRLSLARGFLRANKAKVFVFDEPTSGLDPKSADHVIKAISSLANQNKIVLFSTHRLEELESATQVLYFQKNMNPVLDTHQKLKELHPNYMAYLSKSQTGAEL